MSKVLFIGDPHLKITKFDLSKRFLYWINGVIAEIKPDLVVNLGDTFDTHAVLRSEIITEFMRHVDLTLKVCPYVYLVGNHDMYKPNDSTYHALSHLVGKINNFTIVDKTQNLYGMTFVPYCHTPDIFPRKTLPICVAHQTFQGADYGDITTREGVNSSSIHGAEIIISGHIHKRQRLAHSKSGGPEVVYVGSPFSQNAGDINQIKGISIFDTETLKETFIECPLPSWKGVRYQIAPNFSMDDLHKDLAETLNDVDHWMLEITGPRSEISAYLKSKKAKEIINGRDVKIKTIFTDSHKRQIQIEALSLNQIVSDYIAKIYSGSLDKNLLNQKAIELIDKAKTK